MKKLLFLLIGMFITTSCAVSDYELTYIINNDTITTNVSVSERLAFVGEEAYSYVEYNQKTANDSYVDFYTLMVGSIKHEMILVSNQPITIIRLKYIGPHKEQQ